MFAKNNDSLFGRSSSSSGASILPTFQEKSACDSCCPDLTYKQRLIGFIACAVLGYLISFAGTIVLFGGFSDANIQTFAVLYVIGNIISLLSSGFVSGPKKQCIAMWDKTRRFTTAFYLSMIIVVFVVCIKKVNIWLIIFLFIVEVLAASWYSISFIPYGRQLTLKFLRGIGICAPCFYVSDACSEAGKSLSSGSSGSSGGMFNSK